MRALWALLCASALLLHADRPVQLLACMACDGAADIEKDEVIAHKG